MRGGWCILSLALRHEGAPSAKGWGLVPSLYYFNDTGSDSFLGETLFSIPIPSCPDAGTPTLPSRTISFALSSLPYILRFALPSDRSVEPSRDTPANSPRDRE